jgi:hypothetical protein
VTDFLSLIMLVLASIGALVFGILVAYAILRVAFFMMSVRSKAAVHAKVQPEAAQLS